MKVVAAALAAGAAASPSFCHGLSCPEFTETKSASGITLRSYPDTHWATVETKGTDFDAAMHSSFMELFKYISGDNDKKQKIDMTAPVLNIVTPGQGPNCASTFDVQFYMPKATNPTPTNADVKLTTLHAAQYAVHSFPGFAKAEQITQEAAKLAQLVSGSADLEVAHEGFLFAGYDSPFRLIGRHNEVLIPVKSKQLLV